jgi:hypothetical protein
LVCLSIKQGIPFRLQLYNPAEFVFQAAVLDSGERIVQSLGHLTDAAVSDCDLFILHGQRADRTDYRGGTCTEGFRQFAGFGIRKNLFYVQTGFLSFVSQGAGQLQNAVTGDARQNGTVQAGSDNLVAIS